MTHEKHLNQILSHTNLIEQWHATLSSNNQCKQMNVNMKGIQVEPTIQCRFHFLMINSVRKKFLLKRRTRNMRCSVVLLLHCETGSAFCLHSVWRWIATSFHFQTGYLFVLKFKWILTGIVCRLLRLQFNVPTVCLCRDIWMKCTHPRSCSAHPTAPRRDTCTHFRWKI